MKRSGKVGGIVMLILVSVLLLACKKSENGTMTVRMTDAPSPYAYEEVNIDVIGAEVHTSGGSGDGWHTLAVNDGVYNILNLVNGVDVIIAADGIPAGELSQMRLLLGTNNTIKVDGQKYPLTIPSGSESGLKLNIHKTLQADENFDIIIDFDAAHSIVKQGNGDYKLTPVLHAFTLQGTGAIKGQVSIPGQGIAIIAENGTNSYTTFANKTDGKFMIRGMAEGTYTVKVYSKNSDVPIVIPNVAVVLNAVFDLQLVVLPL